MSPKPLKITVTLHVNRGTNRLTTTYRGLTISAVESYTRPLSEQVIGLAERWLENAADEKLIIPGGMSAIGANPGLGRPTRDGVGRRWEVTFVAYDPSGSPLGSILI